MSIQSSIQNFHPSAKFFLLLALFVIFLFVGEIIQLLIFISTSDIKSINELANLSFLSKINPNILKLSQALSVIVSFIIPAFLFSYFSSAEKSSYLKLNKGFSLALGISVVILVFSVMPIINWAGEINSHMKFPEFIQGIETWMKDKEDEAKKLTESFLQMDGIVDLLGNLIVIALLAAVGEELFFRGCMQNIFVEWFKNKHAAVWITAILFSALHVQFYGFLPRMLLGVVLGYIYIWSGSLWLSILFHFLNNGMAVIFSFLISKGSISEQAETVGSGETPFYYVIGSALVSIGILMFIQKQSIKTIQETN